MTPNGETRCPQRAEPETPTVLKAIKISPTMNLRLTKIGFTLLLSTTAALADDDVITKHSLTLEGAKKIAAAAVAYAKSNGAPGSAIAVVDDGGHLLYFERLNGTFTAGPSISIG